MLQIGKGEGTGLSEWAGSDGTAHGGARLDNSQQTSRRQCFKVSYY